MCGNKCRRPDGYCHLCGPVVTGKKADHTGRKPVIYTLDGPWSGTLEELVQKLGINRTSVYKATDRLKKRAADAASTTSNQEQTPQSQPHQLDPFEAPDDPSDRTGTTRR